VGPRTVPEAIQERKILFLTGIESHLQPVARRCTDWAIAALNIILISVSDTYKIVNTDLWI
jgi:hypothetical protein